MYKKQKGKFRPIVATIMSLVLVLSPCTIWHINKNELTVDFFNEIDGNDTHVNNSLIVPEYSFENDIYKDLEPDESSTTVFKEIANEPSAMESRLSDSDIDLIALITMAEAEGECEDGQRLVIDVILNRLKFDCFSNTIYDIIYSPKQFTSTVNGRVDRCYVRDDIRQLVIEELEFQMNYDIVYFRAGRYGCGTPAFKVGNHYFSTL